MAYVFGLVAAAIGVGVGWLVSKVKKPAAPTGAHAGVGVVPGAVVVPGAHAPGVVPPTAAMSGLGGLASTLENMKNIASPVTETSAPGGVVPVAAASFLPAGPARNMAVQEAINLAGYEPPLLVDGVIGPKSVAGIKWWQLHHPPLVVDGQAGPKTLASMGLASVST